MSRKIHKFFMTQEAELISGLLHNAGYQQTQDILQADIVVFTGGADVPADWAGYPEVYAKLDKKDLAKTKDAQRCSLEHFYYNSTQSRGAISVGICRGAQILWCFNGGQLWYDVDNHQGDHEVFLVEPNKKKLEDYRGLMISASSENKMSVSSTHHQMCKTGHDTIKFPYIPLCLSMESSVREPWVGPKRVRGEEYKKNAAAWHHVTMDLEAYFIPHTQAFGVQFHPEYDTKDNLHKIWFLETLEELVDARDKRIYRENVKRSS